MLWPPKEDEEWQKLLRGWEKTPAFEWQNLAGFQGWLQCYYFFITAEFGGLVFKWTQNIPETGNFPCLYDTVHPLCCKFFFLIG